MKLSTLAGAMLSVSLLCGGSSASAQSDHRWQGGPGNRNWDPARAYDGRRDGDRRLTRADYVYRGHDGRYYCRRSNGTTGLVVGGIGGAVLGNAIGGDTLGTLLGAAAGAVAGRAVDRGRVHCR